MRRTLDVPDYNAWSTELNRLRWCGGERDVFSAFGPAEPLDATPGKVEVRSAYTVLMSAVGAAKALTTRAQSEVWPELDWGGQNQQMLRGKVSQRCFVWTSTWESLGACESVMGRTVGHETFQTSYGEFLETVGVGGSREAFRNF